MSGRTNLLWAMAGTAIVLAVALFPRMAETSTEPVFDGTFEQQTMAVNAATAGRVRDVCAHEGDRVKAGQVLLRLDDDELRATYRRAQAGTDLVSTLKTAPPRVVDQMIELNPEVHAAESDYVDALEAYEDARGSGAEAAALAHRKLENATRRRTQIRREVSRRVAGLFASADDLAVEMKHDLDRIETQLARAALTAPCNGSVDILQLRPGDMVLPGQPVAAIATGQYYVTLHVSRAQLPMFRAGRRVQVEIASGGKQACQGEIAQIARGADLPMLSLTAGNPPETFAVEVRIASAPAAAVPGMRVRIRLGTSE